MEVTCNMPMIRPSSDIRNCYNEIAEYCKTKNEPVFITKNGSSDLVVLSNELFDRLMSRLELHRLLDEGLADMYKNTGVSSEDAIAEIRKETNL